MVVGACGGNSSPVVAGGGASTSTSTATSAPASTTATTAPAVDLTFTGGPGTATATLTYDGDQLCVAGTTDGVGPLADVQVRVVADATVVVDLATTTTADGPFQACAAVGGEGGAVVRDPTTYEVVLTTAAAPDGALRAPLD